MTLYPDHLKQRMCVGKRRYGDKGAAEGRIGRMRDKGIISRTEEMNSYQCPFCSFFHIGHRTKK